MRLCDEKPEVEHLVNCLFKQENYAAPCGTGGLSFELSYGMQSGVVIMGFHIVMLFWLSYGLSSDVVI
jgi:hypothetical protein